MNFIYNKNNKFYGIWSATSTQPKIIINKYKDKSIFLEHLKIVKIFVRNFINVKLNK